MKLLSIMILHKNPSLGQTRLLKGEYELGSFSFFTKRNAQVSLFDFFRVQTFNLPGSVLGFFRLDMGRIFEAKPANP